MGKKTKSEFTNYDIKKIFLNTPRDILLKILKKEQNDKQANNTRGKIFSNTKN